MSRYQIQNQLVHQFLLALLHMIGIRNVISRCTCLLMYVFMYVYVFMYFIKFVANQKIHYDRWKYKKSNNGIGILKHENLRTIVTFFF